MHPPPRERFVPRQKRDGRHHLHRENKTMRMPRTTMGASTHVAPTSIARKANKLEEQQNTAEWRRCGPSMRPS